VFSRVVQTKYHARVSVVPLGNLWQRGVSTPNKMSTVFFLFFSSYFSPRPIPGLSMHNNMYLKNTLSFSANYLISDPQ
jgi:hypothetical protein